MPGGTLRVRFRDGAAGVAVEIDPRHAWLFEAP